MPPPEEVAPVPEKYLHLIGDHRSSRDWKRADGFGLRCLTEPVHFQSRIYGIWPFHFMHFCRTFVHRAEESLNYLRNPRDWHESGERNFRIAKNDP
jgi:hypothetical protein